MKSSRLSQDYIQDILDAMNKAEEFVGTMNLREFLKDDKTSFAVIRRSHAINTYKRILRNGHDAAEPPFFHFLFSRNYR